MHNLTIMLTRMYFNSVEIQPNYNTIAYNLGNASILTEEVISELIDHGRFKSPAHVGNLLQPDEVIRSRADHSEGRQRSNIRGLLLLHVQKYSALAMGICTTYLTSVLQL